MIKSVLWVCGTDLNSRIMFTYKAKLKEMSKIAVLHADVTATVCVYVCLWLCNNVHRAQVQILE